MDLIPDLVEIDREIGSRSLHDFIRVSWHVVEPDQPFIDTWHIGLLAEHYEACLRGEIRRLVVNIPPGMSKSRLTCVFFPTYAWLERPGLRWLNASYDLGLTTRDAGAALDLMQSEWFKKRWGDRFLLPKVSPVRIIQNSAGGWRYATSTGGKAVGWHADVQVIDDPNKPQGLTKTLLEDTGKWMKTTMASRWRRPGLDCRIIIMQRLHTDDLAARALEEGAVHIRLPMEFRPTLRCETKWGRDPRTEDKELLCPDRFDEEAVKMLKKEMGGMVASAQLDQDPVPEGGAIFKSGWFKHWVELPARFEQTLFSWDCAFKGTDSSDFVVGQLWGRKGGEYWLIDQVKGRWSFTETLAEFRKFARKWPKVITKIVEDKANGSAVIDTLHKEISGILEVNPEGGKEARANAVSPLFEAGNVWIPTVGPAAAWVDEYETELTKFPMGSNDDQVDATSQALLYLHKKRSYLAEAMKRLAQKPAGG